MMDKDLYRGLIVVGGIGLWIALGIVWRYLSIRGIVNARTMLHKERMAALAAGRELPQDYRSERLYRERIARIPLKKIGVVCALLLVGLGLGVLVGFQTSESQSLRQAMTLGWIPLFLGIALLVYPAISGEYKKPW
jgi:hypothetical protein